MSVLNRFRLALVIGLIFMVGSVGQSHAQQAPISTLGLHVAGNQILNADEQVVILTGVDRSSFENYCLHPDWGAYHEGPADQSEVAAMQAWHINVVRISLNEDCWLGLHGDPTSPTDYQADVSKYVTLLTQNNIAVILTLLYATPDNTPDSMLSGTGGRQWPMPNEAHSPDFWKSVSSMFRDNSRVIFGLYNEPNPDNLNAHGPAGSSPDAWIYWRDGGPLPYDGHYWSYETAGMQELVTTVRKTGATNIILIPGNDWASDLSHWVDYLPVDPLGQLVAGWHSYGDGLACQDEECWNSVLAPLMAQYPLVADEIGELDCGHSYIDRVVAFLDAHGGGYLAHTWAPHSCLLDSALITDWSGTPTQTYGQGVHDHMVTGQ